MNSPKEPSRKLPHGIASLFDDSERKELFKKYLFFLGWMEVLIFAACWIYQLGSGGHDQYGPIDLPFPWKSYFLVAFLAPVAITFLIGVVIVGFNKYFADAEPIVEAAASLKPGETQTELSGRLATLNRVVSWVQKLPFLALLLLLSVGAVLFYKLDVILSFVGSVGEQTIKVLLYSAIGLVGLVSVFLLILIVLNFQLRKKSMDYQYRSEVAERFGLIILDDKTVLNSEGKLLINGKKGKATVPLLPATASEVGPPDRSTSGVMPRPADPETT
jgi:hypothetical protein